MEGYTVRFGYFSLLFFIISHCFAWLYATEIVFISPPFALISVFIIIFFLVRIIILLLFFFFSAPVFSPLLEVISEICLTCLLVFYIYLFFCHTHRKLHKYIKINLYICIICISVALLIFVFIFLICRLQSSFFVCLFLIINMS